jgi:hypothetical protein
MGTLFQMINLVRIGFTDFSSDYLEWIFTDQFNLLNYNVEHTYNKDCLFVISRPNNYSENIIPNLLEKGHRVIIANPWEARPYLLAKDYQQYQDQILVLLGCNNPYNYGWKNVVGINRWFWYNEHLWYTCDQRIRNNIAGYSPKRINDYKFLMPIQRSKKFRDRIVEKFEPILDQAIWSYVERYNHGQSLPRYTQSPFDHIRPDRIIEPNWYDQTYFTVAVETAVNRLDDVTKEITGQRSEDYPCDLFVTEKTFKPIAFQHPFIVCGMTGTLKFLHENGFETYENLFDESYDTIELFEDRLDLIYNNIENFNQSKYLEPITEQKIQHNYHRFNDRNAVLTGFKKDVIEPILEFFNAT